MFDEIEKLPVYQKAREIVVLAEHICESLKEDEQTDHIRHQILSNAMIINVKIVAAAESEIYSLKIENALKVKFAVREMFEGILFARLFKINPGDYVQLMRQAIEEFRLTFIAWVRGFDASTTYKDDWAIRFVIDQTDDCDVKMVSDEANEFDPDDPDIPGLNWDDEE